MKARDASNVSDLVFVGIKGSVVALNRHTGAQVWATHLKGWDFVNVVVEDGKVLATSYGEIFCLNALTGEGLWHNRLKGFGTGLMSLATLRSTTGGNVAARAAKHRADEEASSAGATAAV